MRDKTLTIEEVAELRKKFNIEYQTKKIQIENGHLRGKAKSDALAYLINDTHEHIFKTIGFSNWLDYEQVWMGITK